MLRRYIEAFQSGFDEGLKDVQLSFMQSDGGLSPVSSFCGHKAVLSGPAGGYYTDCCKLLEILDDELSPVWRRACREILANRVHVSIIFLTCVVLVQVCWVRPNNAVGRAGSREAADDWL